MKSRHQADAPLVCEVFTEREILDANRRHDERYGWSARFPKCYFNPRRLPETVIGEPWQENVLCG